MGHFFYSLKTFIVALFFIMLGVIAVLMPWYPAMRDDIIRFLLENSIAISLFGIAFLIMGVGMVVNVILSTRRHYYEFTVGNNTVKVDEDLIQKYLHTYFLEVFPTQEVPCRLTIKKNLLHVTADLPYVPTTQRDVVVEKIQQDLKQLFSSQLGYNAEYYLSTSFQADKNH